jgi:predicted outer membrane repeat protein
MVRNIIAIASALLALVCAPRASAATFCVNPSAADAARTHATLHQAIVDAESNGAGEDIIKLSNDTHITNPVTIAGQLRILGGYANCMAATPTLSSRINGGTATESIMRVVQFISPPRVRFERVEITSGDDTFDGKGGAIEAIGAGTRIELGPGTSVHTNSASGNGGAIHLANAMLVMETGTSISNNVAGVDGGGIYCDHGSIIQGLEGVPSQTAALSNNRAGRDGGAILAVNGCNINLFGGSNVNFSSNSAARSGGAMALFNTPMAIRSGTSITSNSAALDGGGIFCGGLVASPTGIIDMLAGSVQGNTAGHDGGGFHLQHDCFLRMYGTSVVSSNQANNRGGGISAAGLSDAVLSRSTSQTPVGGVPAASGPQILFNRACGGGGGISVFGSARLQLYGAVVSGNQSIATATCASAGGAGIRVETNSTASGGLVISAHPTCPFNEACNQIESNLLDQTGASTASGDGVEATGAAIYLVSPNANLIERTSFRNNTLIAKVVPGGTEDNAHGAVIHHEAGTSLALRHSVVADNVASGDRGSMLYLNQSANIHYTTFARNAISASIANGGSLIERSANANGSIFIGSSILDDTAFKVIEVGGGNPLLIGADCSLIRLAGDVPNQTRVTSLPAAFMNASAGDFRPAPNASQIDYCDGPFGQGYELDADGLPRGLANPSTVMGFGNYDAGAYESQTLDEFVFSNGFE